MGSFQKPQGASGLHPFDPITSVFDPLRFLFGQTLSPGDGTGAAAGAIGQAGDSSPKLQ